MWTVARRTQPRTCQPRHTHYCPVRKGRVGTPQRPPPAFFLKPRPPPPEKAPCSCSPPWRCGPLQAVSASPASPELQGSGRKGEEFDIPTSPRKSPLPGMRGVSHLTLVGASNHPCNEKSGHAGRSPANLTVCSLGLPIFVNKVLLARSHTRSFLHCPRLLLFHKGRAEQL